MKRKFIHLFIFLISVVFIKVSFAGNTATRNLPFFYVPGGTFNVTINVMTDVANPSTGVLVREYLPQLPQNWTITSSVPESAQYIPLENRYKWGPFFSRSGVLPFTITYTVQVPSDANGVYGFSGTLTFTEEESPIVVTIGGNATIIKEGTFLLGNINGDGTIDISDVVLCLRMAIGLSVTIQEETYNSPYPAWLIELADMNGVGGIDISDVILVLRKAIDID
ncbi:MAG: dockerin type I repeat-containing protein [Candidatus Theseobacter exili]|nr:dockerin type I repeat-containing protein [Candidatus Theseobacter exili]